MEPVIEPAIPAAPVADTESLNLIGRSTAADGVDRYHFKDTRSGRILTLSPGVPWDGWILTLPDENRYSLEGPGGLYEVNK